MTGECWITMWACRYISLFKGILNAGLNKQFNQKKCFGPITFLPSHSLPFKMIVLITVWRFKQVELGMRILWFTVHLGLVLTVISTHVSLALRAMHALNHTWIKSRFQHSDNCKSLLASKQSSQKLILFLGYKICLNGSWTWCENDKISCYQHWIWINISLVKMFNNSPLRDLKGSSLWLI